MTLKELAAQYRADCEIIQKQIARQKKEIKKLPKTSAARISHERNVLILEEMYRDTFLTAIKLEHYYDKE